MSSISIFDLIGDRRLRQDTIDLVLRYPESKLVIDSLIKHFTNGENQQQDQCSPKKRKLEQPSTSTDGIGSPKITINDLSFAIPGRKKLSMTITSTHLVAHPPNAISDAILTLPLKQITTLCVVPDATRAAKTWVFCLFPEGAVFSIPDATKKLNIQGDVSSIDGGYELMLSILHDATGAEIQVPKRSCFISNLKPMASSKNVDFYSVPAHKGTREGLLYFLPGGILFGFKKPVQFYRVEDIQNLAFHSIVSRTFNISVETAEVSDEFSMIDQVDFDGIKTWMDKVGVADESMNEKRRQKLSKNLNSKGGDVDEEDDDKNVVGENENSKNHITTFDSDEEDEDYVAPDSSNSEVDGSDDSDDSDRKGHTDHDSDSDEDDEPRLIETSSDED